MIRVNDTIRLRLDGGGTRTVTVNEILPPDWTVHRAMGAWAYAKDGSCYWLDTEDGHAYKADRAASIGGHVARFAVPA